MNSTIKTLLFGRELAARRLHVGLLRGLQFEIDPNHHTQRIVGLEEREISSVVREFAQQAKTAVDVGANDGWYTVFFAAQPNIQRVYACEPSVPHHAQLIRNLSLNQQIPKVELLDTFIGCHGKEACSLDYILKDAVAPIIIKIDVDGAELDVLKSAEETMRRKNLLFIVETHSAELERACQQFLDDHGYRCTIIRNGWYRAFVPEKRPIAHNRWFSATPAA